MTFAEIIAATVPEKQEAVRQALAGFEGAVKIASRDDAAKLFASNDFVRAEVESIVSKRQDSFEKNFQAEKLPGLIEAKLREAAPKPKDPELAAALDRVQKLERAAEEAERGRARAVQRAKVLGKLGELGLDEKLADRFIGETDEETDALFFKGALPALQTWRDGYAEKILRDRFGNQPAPAMGASASTNTQIDALKQQYADLSRAGQMDRASSVISEIERIQGLAARR